MKKAITTITALVALAAFTAPVVADLGASAEQACGGEKPTKPKPKPKPKPIQPS